ncbi:hypothetical protein B4O97_03615 [Marispirochaeta aestuarii]|uniref:Uncharacterized protein n=1 Tax=Marispirochaeta aestuarii TaxID=1963862 RepID=A0A1Y1S1C0_9SPIO|nr:hypothetical protein B4O97_03615 [Marispirochaeta aestuarii]
MSKKAKAEPDLSGALKETFRLTVGGEWVKAHLIRRIAKLHGIPYGTLLDEAVLSISDSNQYVCDPAFRDEDDPLTAPDEG